MGHTDDLDPLSGLLDDFDVSEDLARSQQRLRVRHDRRRYGKPVTIVEGFDTSVVDLKSVASSLKRRLAVGGSIEDDALVLQGNHDERLRLALDELGFVVD